MTDATTVQKAIATILDATGVASLPDTVDTIKTGDPTQRLAGIVTTFLATSAVIARAVQVGANLIITHEPTFYGHEDDTDWLEEDAVYQAKRRLIDQHRLVLWRFHDYLHRVRPDVIIAGVVEQLGWDYPADDSWPPACTIPLMPLASLATLVKERLGTPAVRVSGPHELPCRRVGLAVGALGGRVQMAMLQRDDVDAIICGELNEWETCEYVRDATFFGRPRGLIVAGHATSEEAGMAYLARWLRPYLPGVAITHVPAGDPLRVM